jgi:2-methylcitrate dehydratase PrpD
MGVPHLLKGWHPTGTSGVFGAAAAAGRILELDGDTMLHALGTAGPHAGGLIAAQYGGMVKRLYVGHAAQSGLFSVFLAQNGFKGIEDVLEAPYGGYVRTFDGRGDPAEIIEGLGERYELLNTGFKRYPTAGAIHGGVDALEQILNEHSLSAGDVESITAYVSHSTKEHCGWPYRPSGATGAQMNLSFALASRFLRGKLFVAEFEHQQLTAPDLLELVKKVRIEVAADIDKMGEGSRYSTRVVVRTRSGREHAAAVHHPKGTVANPFTPAEVETKFRQLATAVLPAAQVENIVKLVRSLDEIEDIALLERELATQKNQ